MIEVLVVDDSPEYRDILKTTIDLDKDLEVVGLANDGYEAVSQCEALAPKLVIMDYLMDKCDGLKGTRMIKSRFPTIKVLVMTSIGNEHNLSQALEFGADGYFVKGIETPKLKQAIKNTINGIPTIDQDIFIP
jgi:DNA-binding NarL/FixJ family response regulator